MFFAQRNEFSYEKLECFDYKNICTSFKCDLRPIARDRYNAFAKCNLTRPITTAHAHIVLKYRRNTFTYETFLVDVWEDMCAFLSGSLHGPVLSHLYPNVAQYTNINHSCPYTGNVFISMKNISSKAGFIEPMLPAGRFRVDVDVAESRGKQPFAGMKFYVRVSDNRLKIY